MSLRPCSRSSFGCRALDLESFSGWRLSETLEITAVRRMEYLHLDNFENHQRKSAWRFLFERSVFELVTFSSFSVTSRIEPKNHAHCAFQYRLSRKTSAEIHSTIVFKRVRFSFLSYLEIPKIMHKILSQIARLAARLKWHSWAGVCSRLEIMDSVVWLESRRCCVPSIGVITRSSVPHYLRKTHAPSRIASPSRLMGLIKHSPSRTCGEVSHVTIFRHATFGVQRGCQNETCTYDARLGATCTWQRSLQESYRWRRTPQR